MKKIISVLLLVAMAATLLVGSAFAAGTSVTIAKVDGATADSTVYVDVKIEGNTGFDSLQFYPTYNSDVLTYKGVSTFGSLSAQDYDSFDEVYKDVGEKTIEATNGKDGVVVAGTRKYTGNGVIFTLKFDISETAEPGEYTIGLKSWNDTTGSFVAMGTEMLSASLTAGSITVKGEEHTCTFDQEVAEAQYLKSDATCQSAAVYYKSCTCKACDKTVADTFTYGDKNPDNHAGTLGTEWKTAGDKHYQEYSCCGAHVAEHDAQWDEWQDCADGTHHEGKCQYQGCTMTTEHDPDWDTEKGAQSEDGTQTIYPCKKCTLTKTVEKETKPEGGNQGGGNEGGNQGGEQTQDPKPTDNGGNQGGNNQQPGGNNQQPGGGKKDDGAKKAPKTGDESNLALWASVLLVACGTAVVIATKKKEN